MISYRIIFLNKFLPATFFADHKEDSKVDPGHFVMKLLGEQKMSQTDLKVVMDFTNQLVKTELSNLLSHLHDELEENECSAGNLEIIKNCQLNFLKEDLFKTFRDQYNQQKYFANYYNLIMPEKVDLPTLENDMERRGTGKGQKNIRNHSYEVPIVEID